MTETLVEQIIRHEGRVMSHNRHVIYTDTVGKRTIGYGRNLDDRGISDSEARIMLHNDINDALNDLLDKFDWFGELNQVRQGVLINMCFNLGINRLKNFKNMLAALEAQDYDLAAQEMLDSMWASQVKGRATELAEQMRSGK